MANRRGIRVLVGAGAIALVLAGALLWLTGRGPTLAPDFAVPDLAGQAVRLSALRGKVVVLNLWTTWCPPCRQEMPSMQRLYEQFRDRDFQLLAVSQDEGGRAAVEPFVRELGLTFPVLVDPEHQVGDRYSVWGYPETFIIDRAGRVVERVIGPREWDAPASRAGIEALLAADAMGASPMPRGPS